MLIELKTYKKIVSNTLKTKYFFVLLFTLFSATCFSQANVYVLKAVYIEKFSRFLTWPEESLMQDINKPFIITVIGKTPLTDNLEQIYSVQKINNKSVVIKHISDLYEIKDCHILFIADSERKNLQNIIAFTKNLPILTIAESDGFAEKGVMINFFEENNKLRFEINETAVLNSPLQMSFYLLNTAKIVKPINNH